MSHAHANYRRPRGFRVFCTNRYWENRDEYEGFGQVQPHSFEEYVSENLDLLRSQYRPYIAKRVQELQSKG